MLYKHPKIIYDFYYVDIFFTISQLWLNISPGMMKKFVLGTLSSWLS